MVVKARLRTRKLAGMISTPENGIMISDAILEHIDLDLDKIFGESKKVNLVQIEKSVDQTDFEIKETESGFDVTFTDSDGKVSLAFFKTIKASESWLDMMMGASNFVSDSSLSAYNSKANGRHFY